MRNGETLIFLDETGLMLQPTVRRTWAPSGQTPLLDQTPTRERLSTIGALSISPTGRMKDFIFSMQQNNVVSDSLVQFLRELHYRFRKRVVLIWDNLRAHYKAAKYFKLCHPNWFQFEYLPSYAPELNPVESCWSHTKYSELANYAPADISDLRENATLSMRKLRRNNNLLSGFLKHTKLLL